VKAIIPFTRIGERLKTGFQNGIYKPATDYSDEGIPIIRINDYGNDGVKYFENLRRVNLSEMEAALFSLKRNDILINPVNSLSHIGKSCIVEDQKDVVVFESNMMRLRVPEDSGILPEYLFFNLNSARARDYFRKVAKPAVAQVSINQDDARSLAIYLPSIDQQTAIADLLSTWDAAIEKTEKLIVAKETQKHWLMQQLLTGRKRLHGFTAAWKKYHLGDLFTERSETGYQHLPLLSITREEGVIPRSETDRKDTSSADKSRYLRICPAGTSATTPCACGRAYQRFLRWRELSVLHTPFVRPREGWMENIWLTFSSSRRQSTCSTDTRRG